MQIELLRRASPTRRAALALNASQWVRWLSRRAIREAHPELDEQEVALLQLELDHGPDLARRLRAWLAARQ